jgi:O-antigen/teichoic acid export membrane protein
VDSQYRSILKATSIFGGTQFVQILVGLVRSKFVALLIGTTGMGLNSIYMSSLTVFITVFGMGINMSVVKDLSKAYDAQDWQGYAKISKAFNRILLFLGITGTLFVIAISSLLSDWSFNDSEHIGAFCFLSLIVLFTLLSQGNTALLISSRRIKSTAACSIVSSIASLLIAVPFFYFWRLDGVVPGIVFSTIANYVVTLFYVRSVKLEPSELSVNETWKLARSFIVLGMAMVIASLMGNVTSYLINLFINRFGGLSDLGLYGAGFTITFQTLSMVFAAMGADYFPRLSAAMGNKDRMNQTINEQSEILLLLSTPILAVFMIVAPVVIRVLLSEEFLPVTGFIRILCLGMLLRAASYALGYASFAKGDKKVYLFVEGGYSNVSNLLLAVLFYYLWGLNGMAWAFVINYSLYYLVIKYIDSWRYGYQISDDLLRLIVYSTIALLCLLGVSYIMADVWYYSIGSVFAVIICYYYLQKLNQKTDLFNKLLNQIGFHKSY